ncbi:RseA family anti-sigma factor [Luteimonas kalidii]|uniref:RseA family anti-sigma factor n=1 Tax=Luteimonas kalidii TaxID=3042025 RepID=A0ABT6JVP5_9GAMM|nr:RseA family anti-sigma factor [Luteimonas kalidii]MDH5834761.1 RseA family anti-sigma factor [Luteimonas kalidii]
MTHVDDNEPLQIGPDPDKLFVYHRQQLSAMLDGELSPDEARFMLRRLQHDTTLASCWERWQVCGDVMRGQHNDLLPRDFAERIALSLAGGSVSGTEPGTPARSSRPRIARWGGGAALAASVALLAVFASRQLPEPGAVPQPADRAPLVAEAGSTPAAPLASVPNVSASNEARVAQAEERGGAPEAATALAAAALAVAETPRRAAERRTRAQSPAVARVRQARPQAAPALVADAPPAVAVNASPIVLERPDAVAVDRDPFAMPPAATARPWPRSLLPAAGAYTVAGGGLAPREPAFEPFRPASAAASPWPVSEVASQAPDAAPPPQP